MQIEFNAETYEGNSPCTCADCGASLRLSELRPIKDPEQRIGIGETVPAGECPHCGALAHANFPLPSMQLKALDWNDEDEDHWFADGLAGRYTITAVGEFFPLRLSYLAGDAVYQTLIADYRSLEEAQAAARTRDVEAVATYFDFPKFGGIEATLAALKAGRDELNTLIYDHVYDIAGGDVADPNDSCMKVLAQMDAVLASVEGRDTIKVTRGAGTYLWATHSRLGLLDKAPFAGLAQVDVLRKRLSAAYPDAIIVEAEV